jgi:hypothetical protein
LRHHHCIYSRNGASKKVIFKHVSSPECHPCCHRLPSTASIHVFYWFETIEYSEKFGVIERTLWRSIAKGSTPAAPGASTVLTEQEEQELSGYALNMQKLSFGLTKDAVNAKIMQIL